MATIQATTERAVARWTRGVALATLVIALGAWAAPTVSGQAPVPGAGSQAASDEYRIGPEDQLDIVFWENPGLTRNVRVRPDGRISLPLVNDVRAADLTPMELRDVITRSYAKLMTVVPDVAVIVAQVHSSRASVLGQVNTPGRFDLGSRTTVLDALAMAGGFNTFAKRDRVVVHRRDGSTVVFNFDRAIETQDFKSNIVLMSGDIIIVP